MLLAHIDDGCRSTRTAAANLRFSEAEGSSFLSEALCLGFSLSPELYY